jgi:hypothetical protein
MLRLTLHCWWKDTSTRRLRLRRQHSGDYGDPLPKPTCEVTGQSGSVGVVFTHLLHIQIPALRHEHIAPLQDGDGSRGLLAGVIM